MKTLKIAVALFLIFGMATVTVSGQNKPITHVVTLYDVIIPFNCINQNLIGTLIAERTFMYNHMLSKVSGTLYGDVDGLAYNLDAMNSKERNELINWEDFGKKAINFTWMQSIQIRREGKLIGIVSYTYHFTFNANGEYTEHAEANTTNCVGNE
jgi:hypothetical protein